MPMRVTPQNSILRRWHLWFGAALIAEIGWFLALHQRIGGGFGVHVKLTLPPLAVVGYIYLLGAVSVVLDELDWDYRMRQLIVIMLGLSVGFFVFALMTFTSGQLEGAAG